MQSGVDRKRRMQDLMKGMQVLQGATYRPAIRQAVSQLTHSFYGAWMEELAAVKLSFESARLARADEGKADFLPQSVAQAYQVVGLRQRLTVLFELHQVSIERVKRLWPSSVREHSRWRHSISPAIHHSSLMISGWQICKELLCFQRSSTVTISESIPEVRGSMQYHQGKKGRVVFGIWASRIVSANMISASVNGVLALRSF